MTAAADHLPKPVVRPLGVLLALVVLLQALWLPFHLATEAHLPIGADTLPIGGRSIAAGAIHCHGVSPGVGVTAGADEDRQGHEPHSLLDHEIVKQARAERRLPQGSSSGAHELMLALPPTVGARVVAETGALWPLPPPEPWVVADAAEPQAPRAPPAG